MSTRFTIWCSEHWQSPDIRLYQDLMDEKIHLEIRTGESSTDIVIPPEMLAKIRKSEICGIYAVDAGVRPFTLLKVQASEPIHGPFETVHHICVTFARKDTVKFNTETLEVQSSDLVESFITFRVGDDMREFTKGLRDLADHLDSRA